MYGGCNVLMWVFAKIFEFIEEIKDADGTGPADFRTETQV